MRTTESKEDLLENLRLTAKFARYIGSEGIAAELENAREYAAENLEETQ